MVPRAERSSAAPSRTTSLVVTGLAISALAGLVVAFVVGGDLPSDNAVGGIPEASLTVQWALPVAQTLLDLAAATTVGLLLAAAALLPSSRDLLAVAPARAARVAAWFAWGWAVLALAVLVLSYAETFATSVPEALSVRQLLSFAGQSQ